MQLQVNVSNTGAKFITIERFALTVKNSHGKKYILEPFFFHRLNDKGNFMAEAMSGPVPVLGNSTIIKGISFRSSVERPSEFQFLESGRYNVTLWAWVGDSMKPCVKESFSFDLAEKDTKNLAQYLQQKKQNTVRVTTSKWKKWSPRYLTEVEEKVLER